MRPNPLLDNLPDSKPAAVMYLSGVQSRIRWLNDMGYGAPIDLVQDCYDLERHVLRMGTRDEVENG